MKKILSLLAALALLVSLCGCGGFVSILPGTELPEEEETAQTDVGVFEARPLLTFLNRESFAESYYDRTPAALSYQPEVDAEGTRGCRAYVFDRASVIAACDALRGMTVTARSDEAPISSAEYILTMPDGTEYDFTFGLLSDGVTRVVDTYTGAYVVTGGDALWDIPFPAYSQDFDVFDLYFDPAVRAFADGFYENTPVSVGYRVSSGATITTDDPVAVDRAFQALAAATVIVVENQPDQNVDLNQQRTFIFTMADGSTYSFAFAQRCLAVTANAAFGPVYYWLDGTDALWSVDFSPESGERFSGGTVADLREDFAGAAAAADGESELTVDGVFVEYAIDGESGYITLDGSAAAELVRQVCDIEVTAETAADPAGDTLTVSVTLSDGAGPTVYFTGDSVQQLVGTSYMCAGADMSALRDTVLAYAAESGGAAVIEEGGTD